MKKSYTFRALSLSSRVFLLMSLLLGVSLIVVLFIIRPTYDRSLVEERMTVIAEQQRYAQETVDRQINSWISATRYLSTLFTQQPHRFEQAIKEQIAIRGELAIVRAISRTTGDELEARNTAYPNLNFTITDSLWEKCPNDDLIEVAWIRTELPLYSYYASASSPSPSDSAVTYDSTGTMTTTSAFLVFRSYSLFLNDAVTIYTYFDATSIRRQLLNIPIGEGVAVRLDGALKILDSSDMSAPFTKMPVRGKFSQVESVKDGFKQWQITTTAFETLPFGLRIAVPDELILRPARELMNFSLLVVGILAAVMLLFGFLASREVSQPVKDLVEDIQPMSELNFERPIRIPSLPDLTPISETVETMRQSLDRYQKLNVDKVIFEEWKTRFLMTYSQDMIATCDNQGNFDFMNTKMQELLLQLGGEKVLSKQLLFSSPFASLNRERRRTEHISGYRIDTLLADFNLRLEKSDNQVHYFGLQEIDVINNDGALWFSMLILRDQTTERELETIKNETLGIIVHEIRSPLNGITGFADLLTMTDGLSSEAQEYIFLISESALRISKLVNRFLDVMRLESGKMILQREPVLLDEIVTTVIQRLLPASKQKNLEFKFTSDPIIPFLNVSRDLIEEAIQNLMTNAIKYGPSNRTIDMTLKRVSNTLVFSITDFGYGIAPEHHEKLFTKFYRVTNEYTRHELGTGLGLAYVKEIVTRHDGQLSFESRPEIGCCFTISLPIHPSVSPVPQSEMSSAMKPA